MGKRAWSIVTGILVIFVTASSAQQRDSLLNFTTSIANWDAVLAASKINGWTEAAGEPCIGPWSFLLCSGMDVVSLTIVGTSLPVAPQGNISESLVNLTALRQLTLTNTRLRGPLAASWGSQDAFQNLSSLDLRQNLLSGTIPSTWLVPGAMPQLQNMYLDSNMLSGTLSSDWAQEGNMPNVNILSLSNNMLSGTLPSQWGSAGSSGGMSQLNSFFLAGNRLQGTLPAWDQNGLQQMNLLDISHNALSGTLPAAWSSTTGLTRLQTLLLAGNTLTGQLPSQWGNRNQFSSLMLLDLSGNQLTGPVLANWMTPGGWPALYNLTLSNNMLTGQLPSQLGTPNVLPSLVALSIRNTSLNGTLPGAWLSGQLGSSTGGPLPLQFLDLGDNPGLTGSLPEAWGQSQASLVSMSMPHCSFTGRLPASWGNDSTWPAIIAIELTGNQLTGELPSQWARDDYFDNLRLLLLGDNNLSGQIPNAWGTAAALPVLKQLDLAGNNFYGAVEGGWTHLLANSSIYLTPGNPGLCGPFPSQAFVGRPAGCVPTATSTCTPTSLQGLFSVCPNASLSPPASAPDASLNDGPQLMNATLILLGVDPGSFTPQLLAVVAQAVQQQLSFPDPVVNGTSWAPAILTGRRRLLQNGPRPSTAVAISIEVTGQQQYDTVMADLADMTRPGAGLLALLQAKIPSLQAVQLASAVIILPHRKQHPADVGTIAAAVLAPICFLLLGGALGAWGWHRYKRRRGRSAGLGSHQSSEALQPGDKLEPFDSARVHEMLQLSRSAKESEDTQGTMDLNMLSGSDWLVAPEDIQLCTRPDGSLHLLGEGGFGTVYKAIKGGIAEVAVKVMGHAGTGGTARQAERLLQDQEAFRREILLLKSCRDRHIVQFLGACLQPPRLMLVTEYMAGGDLFTALARDRAEPRKFSWSREALGQDPSQPARINGLNKRIALDLARGVAFLHSRRTVHFDVKSANCLLGRDGSAKLTDVGMAKIMRHKFLSTLQGQLGTFAWAAPEILLGRECTEKVDIYSLGVVLWELSSGMQPSGRWLQPLRVGEDCTQAVKDLIMACLAEEPQQRPSALELIQMLTSL